MHLGDVIVEGHDIHGDGVNIAAHLESIAEPGGICVSRQVYDQVQKKLTLGYRNLGPRILKNIPDAIEVLDEVRFPGDPTIRDMNVLPILPAPLLDALTERGDACLATSVVLGHAHDDTNRARVAGLLSARGERPGDSCTADCGYELPPSDAGRH